jgi:hypothetical protein
MESGEREADQWLKTRLARAGLSPLRDTTLFSLPQTPDGTSLPAQWPNGLSSVHFNVTCTLVRTPYRPVPFVTGGYVSNLAHLAVV